MLNSIQIIANAQYMEFDIRICEAFCEVYFIVEAFHCGTVSEW
jgi:hypothetical protein